MLDFIRKRSRSFVIQILFGLLILSFVAWGIGDFVRGGSGGEAVIEVGDAAIGPNQVYTAFRREVDRVRQTLGTSIDNEQAKALGIDRLVVQRLIRDTLIDLAGRDLGLTVSDPMVLGEIQSIDAFKDESGRFNRDLFTRRLQGAGLTEAMFVAQVRQDLGRATLAQAIGGGLPTPDALAGPLYRYRAERRVAEVVQVSPDAVPAPDAPTSEQLAIYHETHAERYTAPEARALAYVSLLADDLSEGIAVPEERIAALYEDRKAQFDLPERRQVVQAVLPDEAAARHLVASGGPLADPVDLGLLRRDEMPLPALGDLAFSLAEGRIGGPVQSPFGWHVVRVSRIEPPRRVSLGEARDDLRAELAREMAVDELYELSTDLEDSLGGGATLEEAAAALDLKVIRVPAVDQRGLDPEGNQVPGLAATPGFLEVAFHTPENMESLLTEAGADGYFVLRVDRVMPPALKPLSDVRDRVAADWTAERQADAAKRAAGRLADSVRGGANIFAAASEAGTTVVNTAPFTRRGDGVDLPRPLIEALFAPRPGDVVTAEAADGSAYLARLGRVVPPNPHSADGAPQRAALGDALAGQIGEDLMVQFLNGLQASYGVRINRRALNEAL